MVIENLGVEAVLFPHAPGLFRHNVHQICDMAPLGKLQVGLDMGVGNAARADDGYTNHEKHLRD